MTLLFVYWGRTTPRPGLGGPGPEKPKHQGEAGEDLQGQCSEHLHHKGSLHLRIHSAQSPFRVMKTVLVWFLKTWRPPPPGRPALRPPPTQPLDDGGLYIAKPTSIRTSCSCNTSDLLLSFSTRHWEHQCSNVCLNPSPLACTPIFKNKTSGTLGTKPPEGLH